MLFFLWSFHISENENSCFLLSTRQKESLQKCWLKYALTVFLNLKVLSQVYLQQTKHISFSCFHVFHKLQPALLSMESVACCSQFHDHTCSSQEPRKRAWGHGKEPQKKKPNNEHDLRRSTGSLLCPAVMFMQLLLCYLSQRPVQPRYFRLSCYFQQFIL